MNVKWHNKNKETIERGTQKIIRFIHSKSYTSEAIKNNSIYSQILRVGTQTKIISCVISMRYVKNTNFWGIENL